MNNIEKANFYTDNQLVKTNSSLKNLYKNKKLINSKILDLLKKWNKPIDEKMLIGKYNKQLISTASDFTIININAFSNVKQSMLDIFVNNANFTLLAISEQLQVDFDMLDISNLNNELPENLQLQYDKQHSTSQNEKRLNSAIACSIQKNEDFQQLATRISNLLDYNFNTMYRTANTLYTSCQNSARLEIISIINNNFNLNIRKKWISTIDFKTRESHQHLNNVSVDINDFFNNGLLFPGDINGNPEEIYNCRCRLVPDYTRINQKALHNLKKGI